MATKKDAAKKMSAENTADLAKWREQERAVREHLDAFNEVKRPGRKLVPDTINQRIVQTQAQIDAEPDVAKHADLIEKRLDHEERFANVGGQVDLEALEKGFVRAAKEYSERQGIRYSL